MSIGPASAARLLHRRVRRVRDARRDSEAPSPVLAVPGSRTRRVRVRRVPDPLDPPALPRRPAAHPSMGIVALGDRRDPRAVPLIGLIAATRVRSMPTSPGRCPSTRRAIGARGDLDPLVTSAASSSSRSALHGRRAVVRYRRSAARSASRCAGSSRPSDSGRPAVVASCWWGLAGERDDTRSTICLLRVLHRPRVRHARSRCDRDPALPPVRPRHRREEDVHLRSRGCSSWPASVFVFASSSAARPSRRTRSADLRGRR